MSVRGVFNAEGGCLVLELVEYDQHELLGRHNSGEGLGGESEDERGKRSPDGVVQLCFALVSTRGDLPQETFTVGFAEV